MFFSQTKGKVVIHVVLKFKACYKNNVAKFWDRIEPILHQKLTGQTGSLFIDPSSFKFSGKKMYDMELFYSFNLNMVFCYANENSILFFKCHFI
jgi:hypothetical protein